MVRILAWYGHTSSASRDRADYAVLQSFGQLMPSLFQPQMRDNAQHRWNASRPSTGCALGRHSARPVRAAVHAVERVLAKLGDLGDDACMSIAVRWRCGSMGACCMGRLWDTRAVCGWLSLACDVWQCAKVWHCTCRKGLRQSISLRTVACNA